MSTLGVIALVLVVILLATLLVLVWRKAATAGARHDLNRHELGEPEDDVYPYRSHAEESRRSERGGPRAR